MCIKLRFWNAIFDNSWIYPFLEILEFYNCFLIIYIFRQIQVDLPRTNPDMPFFQQKEIQKAMERILYIWSIRHPGSSYVQGMNDLLTPLLLVSMFPFSSDVLRCDIATLDSQVWKWKNLLLYWYYIHLIKYMCIFISCTYLHIHLIWIYLYINFIWIN